MKIAVDCRYLGKSGIGRVNQGILDHFDVQAHEYWLIGRAADLAAYPFAHIVEDESDPFSAKGLFTFPAHLNKVCDCVIIPNFIIPFGIRIPVYTVMHDLIFLDLPEVTTRGKTDFLIKKTLLKRCMKKSVRIACVSDFTRSRCAHFFPKYAHKCYVDYVGLSHPVLSFDAGKPEKRNTLVYVGNVKPHKGLKTLVEAYKMLPAGEYELRIVGDKEGFLTGMDPADLETEGVVFTGRVGDDALLAEIAGAKFLIQPSLYEGFGVPPLEALWLGTKPIISDIPVFREVYGDLDVVFFKGEDAQSLRDAILSADPAVRCERREIVRKYDYALFTQKLLAQIGSNG